MTTSHRQLATRIVAVGVVLACCLLFAAAQSAPAEPNDQSSLRQAQAKVFRAAWRAVTPAIVRIDTIGGAQPVENAPAGAMQLPGMSPPETRFRQADGPTTGVICAADGYIITSSFNFVRDPVVITVTLHDSRQYVAHLIARDYAGGLALLHIDATDLPAPQWAAPDTLKPGRWALAAGYGYGGRTPTLAVGAISALHRLDGRAVQTDAKTSPANYGGPLFDTDGRVIGIIVPKAGDQTDQLAGVEWYDSGIGFAITADYLQRRLPRLRSGENLYRGVLGLQFDSLTPVAGSEEAAAQRAAAGLTVQAVTPGPAEDAGIKPGDIITHIDNEPVPTMPILCRILAQYAAGDTVTLTCRRTDDDQTTEVTLARVEDLAQRDNATTRPTSQPATMPASNP